MLAVKLSAGGRVVVPAEIRKALGLKEGDVLLWELGDGEARIITGRALGLSLGDRACLALTRERGAVALTADQAWQRLDPTLGIAVECVRDSAR